MLCCLQQLLEGAGRKPGIGVDGLQKMFQEQKRICIHALVMEHEPHAAAFQGCSAFCHQVVHRLLGIRFPAGMEVNIDRQVHEPARGGRQAAC